jgi:hypothetical protein
MLQKALDRAPSDMTTNKTLAHAKKGNVIIWVVEVADEVTAVFVAGQVTDDAAEIFLLAGMGLATWLPSIVKQFCGIMALEGLQKVVFSGRRGWQRRLEPLGFKYTEMREDRVRMTRTDNG